MRRGRAASTGESLGRPASQDLRELFRQEIPHHRHPGRHVFLASAIASALGKTPPPSTPAAATVWRGLAASGYFIPLLVAVQATAGLMRVAGRLVPLALALLAPVVVEIVAYRLFAAGAGMQAVSLALLAAEVWLAWRHRAAFPTALTGHSPAQASRSSLDEREQADGLRAA